MKIPKINIKKPNINLAKKMPYIFIATFLIVGLSIVIFGYILLNRAPEKSVVTGAQKEIDDILVKFDKEKINKLFDSEYDISNIKNPGYKTKNPFQTY